MPAKTPITVAYGDGIGPEITQAVLRILEAAGAALDIETIEIGEKVYLRGHTSGIEPAAWDSLRRTKVFLKAPLTMPRGDGFKSLAVTARKALGLYANVRPCVSYYPFVDTRHPHMDVVVVRESVEDLYVNIEYRSSAEETQAVKVISRPGSERIVRYAFEYACRHARRKVTCFTKDNLMKMTDGLFHQVFDEVAALYPEVLSEHRLVDNGTAGLAHTPEAFDVVVTPNLYGDILSGMAAQIAGSVGLAASASIGDQCAMFEAVHGSAPRRAGQNLANPSGLLHAAILMLVHIGQPEAAQQAHNAWLRTIEDGIHTYDIFNPVSSRQKVGTKEFADAVIARLGEQPRTLQAVRYGHAPARSATPAGAAPAPKKELAGVDVYVDWPLKDVARLAETLEHLDAGLMALAAISNRGIAVWPEGRPETLCTDTFRCRFAARGAVTQAGIVQLLGRMAEAGLDIVMTATLRDFDGQPGYTPARGE